MLLLKDMYFIYLKKVYKISVTSVTKEAPCPPVACVYWGHK